MTSKLLDSKVIDLIRFPLAFFVIIHHSFGKPIEGLCNNFLELNAYNQVRCLFSHVLVHIDVPTFFFISGYLFFLTMPEKWDWNLYRHKMIKKSKTLLVPYLLWNIIALFVSYLIKYLFYHENLETIFSEFKKSGLGFLWGSETINRVDFGVFGFNYVEHYPINGPLWFMRDLMVMMLISPIIYWLIKRRRGIFIIVIFSLLYILRLPSLITGLSWVACTFFSFGAYFSLNKKSFTIYFYRKVFGITCLTLLLFALDVFFDGGHYGGAIVHPIFIMCFMITFANFATYAVKSEILSKLVNLKQHCFFLYAGHMGLSLVFIFQYLYRKVIPDTSCNLLLVTRYFLIIFTVTLSCMLLDKMLKFLFPKTMNFITGNR